MPLKVCTNLRWAEGPERPPHYAPLRSIADLPQSMSSGDAVILVCVQHEARNVGNAVFAHVRLPSRTRGGAILVTALLPARLPAGERTPIARTS